MFSHPVMSDCSWPHGLQHARLPCPSPTPRVYSNSYPLSRWCHPTISSSVVPFSSCLQSFPASGSFPVSQLFASGGQSVGVSASGPVLLKSIQGWFSLILTGWISLQSKGPSRVFSSTTVRKLQFFNALLSLLSSSHTHTWLLDRLVCQLYLNKTGEKRNRKGDATPGPAQAGDGGDLKQGRSRARMGGDSKVER